MARRRSVPGVRIIAWAGGSGAAHLPTRSWSLAGRSLAGGAVLTGLVLLAGSVPASAQALTWSVAPSPDRGTSRNILQGVSCNSATSCTAVGYYYTGGRVSRGLIESRNGTRWSLVPSPNQTGFNQLYGVSCTSAATCTAVGYYNSNGSPSGAGTKTLMESWDGTHWSLVSSPSPASSPVLNGISCVSPAACTAAGMRFNSGVFQTLIESGTADG